MLRNLANVVSVGRPALAQVTSRTTSRMPAVPHSFDAARALASVIHGENRRSFNGAGQDGSVATQRRAAASASSSTGGIPVDRSNQHPPAGDKPVPGIEINGVAHIMLTVTDIALSRPFYRALSRFLGLTCVLDDENWLYHVGKIPSHTHPPPPLSPRTPPVTSL